MTVKIPNPFRKYGHRSDNLAKVVLDLIQVISDLNKQLDLLDQRIRALEDKNP